MPRSARRDAAGGVVDRIAGRVLEMWGNLTGHKSSKMKGKAGRGRGGARHGKSRVKRAAS